MTEQHKGNSIAKGTMWSVINNGLSQFLVLGVFLVTARFVSKEDFGLMAISFVVIEFFRQIVIESVATATTALSKPEDKDYNAAFLVICTVSIFASLIIFAIAPLIADILNNDGITYALSMTSLVLLTSGLSRTHEVWLSRHMQFKMIAMRSLFSILAGGSLGIWMAVHNYGISSLIAQQIVTGVVGTVFLWGATDWKPSFKTDMQSIKGLWHNSKHTAMAGSANFVNGQSDTFFATYYLGAAATGVYNAAKRILYAINAIVATALGKVALPAFALVQDNRELLRESYLKATRYTAMVTAPMYAGIAILSEDLINILLGEKWAEVAPVLSILAVTGFLQTFNQYSHSIFLVTGKAHWQSILSAVLAIVSIVVFFAFTQYGLIALAFAFSIRTLMLHPPSVFYTLQILNVKGMDYLKELWPSLLSSALMMCTIYSLGGVFEDIGTLSKLAILIPLGVAVYSAAMLLFDRKNFMELLSIFRDMVKH